MISESPSCRWILVIEKDHGLLNRNVSKYQQQQQKIAINAFPLASVLRMKEGRGLS